MQPTVKKHIEEFQVAKEVSARLGTELTPEDCQTMAGWLDKAVAEAKED